MNLPLFAALLLSQYDTFLFDIDATLTKNGAALPGAVEFFNYVTQTGKNFAIISNNDEMSVASRVVEFDGMGFIGIKNSDIITPNVVMLDHFRKKGWQNSSFYVISKPLVRNLLETELGATVYGLEKECIDENNEFTVDYLESALKKDIKAVVISYSPAFSMVHIIKAANYLKDSKVELYVLDSDKFSPLGGKYTFPIAGVIKATIEAASNRESTLCGKPGLLMGDLVRRRFFVKGRTLMFGDNPFSDIAFANANGFDSCITFTGIHGMKDLLTLEQEKQFIYLPKYQCNFTQLVDEIRDFKQI